MIQSKTTAVISTEQAELIASRLARQQVIAAGKTLEVGGSEVYKVQAGWECAQIRQDPNVVEVTTVAELEAAVQDPEQATIFVPNDAAVTLEILERVLKRNSLEKTIFWQA